MNFDQKVNDLLEMALYSKEGEFQEQGYIYVPSNLDLNKIVLNYMGKKFMGGKSPEELGIRWSKFKKELPGFTVFPISEWKHDYDSLGMAIPEFSMEGQPYRR
jgi:hypothetical protein